MSTLLSQIELPQSDESANAESLGSLAIRLARLAASQHRMAQLSHLSSQNEQDSHCAAAEGLIAEFANQRCENVASSTGKEAC